ncbi:imelysin family protein [Parabacteroides bouchesdurhonensis]|uniref:imelysin family protein n=1 Tax=Parabacteroides bouchesdurhonensis TaxID=1936995 RepID=UPI000C814D73|nr:imelysin family protein [Parabacteroides bouchesdurhonensis]
MKKNLINSWLMGATICATLTFISVSCDEDNTPGGGSNTFEDIVDQAKAQEAVNAYVDKTVIPTYKDMHDKVTALQTAVTTFLNSKTQTNLDAACDAWRAAREPWEESEAFLYGPADYEGLDPSLDSWPLEMTEIKAILANQNWGDLEDGSVNEDGEQSAWGVRGFHTLEYLLFDGGQPRDVSKVTDAEAKYTQIVTNRLLKDTETLYYAWSTDGKVENYSTCFGSEFKQHNTDRFGSLAVVIGQIFDGCIDIAGEVGDSKIGEPYNTYKIDKEAGVLAVESWYSWNSLKDYTDNIISIENSYLGGIEGNRGTSLSDLVKSVDADADQRMKDAIENAIIMINKIPAPLRNNLAKNAEIEAAMDACSELSDALTHAKGVLKLD